MGTAVLQMPKNQQKSPEMPEAPAAERWVGIKELADHLGFSYQTAAKMVKQGQIPTGQPFKSGKNTYWRFKLSLVDAALSTEGGSR